MTTASIFLRIPVEIRLVIYELFLAEHRHVVDNVQPSNNHIRMLYTCRQITHEARPIISRYVSLRHERQINAFILRTDDSLAAQVLWADVANDGRVRTSKKLKTQVRARFFIMSDVTDLMQGNISFIKPTPCLASDDFCQKIACLSVSPGPSRERRK